MKKNSKRILSVTIRRMIDDSPDTSSYLGEYSNRPKTEYAIDRAHLEDCESLRPPFESDGDWQYWNGTAIEALERVRTFLENYQADADHWSSPNGCHEDCPACAEESFYRDAIETVWELEKNAGDCDCSRGGHWSGREYRYFNPATVEPFKIDATWIPATITNAADRKAYWRKAMLQNAKQDYERMESLNASDWCYLGIRAEAKVVVVPFSNDHGVVVQRITSGGLWGIESDSDRSYLDEIQKDELANLKSELLALGFSTRAIATAFKNVQEVDR